VSLPHLAETHSLNFNHLRYFWAVAHEGNLTRAARRLFVSQSAVSVQIGLLEKTLGQKLFERRGKRLELTEAGRITLDHADAIFSSGEELMSLMRSGSGTKHQRLNIGILSHLSRNFQLKFLGPLLRKDGTELKILSSSLSDLLKKLTDNQLDIVLANSAPPLESGQPWVGHAIAQQSVSLVRHRNRHLRGRTLRERLAEAPLVLPSAESGLRPGVDALIDRLGVEIKIAAEVDDMALLRLLARENLGLAVVPSIVVKDELESGLLVTVQSLPGLKETFWAIARKRRFPNPLVQSLFRHHVPLKISPTD
jgi:LysR family transcriptional activator of nhaA